MSEAEYYYVDKGVKRPLKLLSKKNGASADVFPVFIESSSGNIVILTDQITARFRPEASKEAILKLLKENNLSIVRKSRFAPNQYILKITNPTYLQVLNVANALNESESVIFATPNFISQFSKE
jgi:hypothetical protein